MGVRVSKSKDSSEEKRFVAIFTDSDGYPLFIEDGHGRAVLFPTEKAAEEMAEKLPISASWPYVVVEIA